MPTIPSLTATNLMSPQPVKAAAKNQTLNQQDFLKLLTMQLKNQDPMKPMDENSFVSTMAQFTSLQQSSELLTSMKGVGAANKLIAASSMIGREVTVAGEGGMQSTGAVEAVENSADGLQLKIQGKLYAFESVLRVAPIAPQDSKIAPPI